MRLLHGQFKVNIIEHIRKLRINIEYNTQADEIKINKCYCNTDQLFFNCLIKRQ